MSGDATGNAKRRRLAGHAGGRQSKHRDSRGDIAYRAARLIAEEGITSFAAAKQKAARQLGVTVQALLPDNHEIDAALRSHQSLFQSHSQPQECLSLRRAAVAVMGWLDRFAPWLVGQVLTGTANRFSRIELEIVANDAKRLEMFLLSEDAPFETRIRRISRDRHSDPGSDISVYEISFGDFPISIALYPSHAVLAAHHPREGVKHARAQRLAVEALLAE